MKPYGILKVKKPVVDSMYCSVRCNVWGSCNCHGTCLLCGTNWIFKLAVMQVTFLVSDVKLKASTNMAIVSSGFFMSKI